MSAPSSRRHGRVTFVGAGPGDPNLLTLAAAAALTSADVVICDDHELPAMLEYSLVTMRPETRVDVLGELGVLSAQERAIEGETVVRLVPGDPFADAAVATEVRDLLASGVSVEVVPGVSRATSVPEYAGVTYRTGGPVVAAEPGGLPVGVDWPGDCTIVIETTVGELAATAAEALSAGVGANRDTLAVICGGTPQQQTWRGLLTGVHEAGTNSADGDPVTLVIGAAAREPVAWFEDKPLFGWRVLVPRTKDQSVEMLQRLGAAGAYGEEVPTIAVEPPRQPQHLDKAIRGLVEGRFGWVAFTSVNAVRAVRDKLEEYGLDARVFSGVRVAVVGNTTGNALREWGIKPDLVPSGEHSASGLAAEFPAYDELLDPINTVFLPRADIAVDTLVTGLGELGWQVEDVTAYRTVRASPPPAETREAIKSGDFDAVVFTSSSTVRNLVGIAGKPHSSTVIAAIGPQTARTCVEFGLRVDVVAGEPSMTSLVDGLADFAARRRELLLAKGDPVRRPSQRKRRHRKS